MKTHSAWREGAEALLLADREQSAPTPLRELYLPALPGSRLVFKDESVHATGSLKHRLARALLLHGIRRGDIGENTPLFDASSGNTAISEAWFARLLGLQYFAVVPRSTSTGKLELIRQFDGECITVPEGTCCKREAARLAMHHGGHFLDQFLNAAKVVDWREWNVITELFSQLPDYRMPEPDWFVMGAGTGGTASCAGRYFRNMKKKTGLLVVDPEDSAFFGYYAGGNHPSGCLCQSRIEGIGRPQVEASFFPELIDRMTTVPDAASCAGARWLSVKLGTRVGLSTGTNLIGAITLLDENRGEPGIVASLICDDGDRYAGRLDNDGWLSSQRLDLAPWQAALEHWYVSGEWQAPGTFQRFSTTVS